MADKLAVLIINHVPDGSGKYGEHVKHTEVSQLDE